MVTFTDLKNYFREQGYGLVIVADGEPVISSMGKSGVVSQVPAGGVGVALDPISRATNAVYISRGKNKAEREALDKDDKMMIGDSSGNYFLKRLFLKQEDIDNYYYGFSNQVLWPICHITFEKPEFSSLWYEGYKKVNAEFAKSIEREVNHLDPGIKALIWVNDYQLSLVPSLLRSSTGGEKVRDSLIALFWHIPWPTWEIFRIIPYKRELLTSLLSCDFLAFHRG